MNDVTVTVQVQQDWLQQLRVLGYGSTPEIIVAYLLARSFDDLIRAGTLKPRADT